MRTCPRAPIMILQKEIAISLEGRHLVLTLLASSFCVVFACLYPVHSNAVFPCFIIN